MATKVKLIETGAVTGNIIPDGGIATGKLANDAVTTIKISDANITHAKLHTSMDLTGKTVTVATAAGSTNTTAAASTAFVQQELTTLIGGAPSTLNDLNELAAAINDDANYNSTLTTALATKLPLAGGTMTGNLTVQTLVGINKAVNSAVGLSVGSDAASATSYGLEVTNNNANTRFLVDGLGSQRFYGSDNAETARFTDGKLGIGTDNPGYLLTVKKDVDAFAVKIENDGNSAGTSGASYADASDGLWVDTRWNTATNTPFKVTSNSGTSPMMIIKGDGNVGIGTESMSSSYGRLTVAGTGISITPDTAAKMQIGRYNAANPYSYIKAGSTSSGFKFTNSADNLDIFTITNTGDIGIGTADPSGSPAGTFTWPNGLVTIAGTRPVLYLNGSSSYTTLRMWPSGTDGASTAVDDWHVNTVAGGTSTGRLSFQPQGGAVSAAGLSLKPDGKVGIGTFTPPAEGLTIRREGSDKQTLLQLDRPNTAGLQTNIKFSVADIMVGQIQHEYASSNYNHMSFTLRDPGGADVIPLWLQNSGNVGIGGTTDPGQKLTVAGNIEMTAGATGVNGRRIFMGGTSGTTFGLAYDSGNPNYGMFYTEGSPDRVDISPNGSATAGAFQVLGNGNVNALGTYSRGGVEMGRIIEHIHSLGTSNHSLSGSTTAWSATGLTKTVTPQSAKSYFWVEMYHNEHINPNTPNYGGGLRLMGGSTEISRGGEMEYQSGTWASGSDYRYNGNAKTWGGWYNPQTASAITFTAQVAAPNGQAGNYYYWHWQSNYIANQAGPRLRIIEFT